MKASFKFLVLAAVAAVHACAFSQATTYPSKQIRLVVPYPAGGSSDFVARAVGEKLAKALGQPIVVDNKPGASGILGVSEVARAAPDGYTLGLTLSDSLINNQALFKALPYKPERDLMLMTQVVFTPAVVSAGTAMGIKSFGELKTLIASKSPRLSYSTWGNGGLGHIAGETLKKTLNADMVHVPQRGEAPVMQDLLSNNISLGFTTTGLARDYVAAKKIVPLAVLTPKRSSALPDVPTLKELGINDQVFDASVWMGFIAPAKTPAPVVERLVTEIRSIMGKPEMAALMAQRGFEIMNTTPEQFKENYTRERDLIVDRIKTMGIELQ